MLPNGPCRVARVPTGARADVKLTAEQGGNPLDENQPLGSGREVARRCTANSKQSGERCRKWAMVGRQVCLAHGGRSPRGVASPHFRSGRYSKALPDRLAGRYEEALHDARLIELRDDIALADARIVELLQKLNPDSPKRGDKSTWRQIMKLVRQRRLLAQAEWRRLCALRQVMTTEQAEALLAAVVAAIKRHVSDRMTLAAISAELQHVAERSKE